MTENITRCPKCLTSFRISDAHLKTAKGAVRCGSCLHIFNAREFLVSAKDTTPAAKKVATEPKVKEKKVASKPEESSPPNDTQMELMYQENAFDESDEEVTFENFETNDPELDIEADDAGFEPEVDAEDEDLDDDALISDQMEPKGLRPSLMNDAFSKELSDIDFGDEEGTDEAFNLFERKRNDEEENELQSIDDSWALNLLEGDDEEDEADQNDTDVVDEEELESNTSVTPDSDEKERRAQKPLPPQKKTDSPEKEFRNNFTIIEEPDAPAQKAKDSEDALHALFDDFEDDDYDAEHGQEYAQNSTSHNHFLDAIEPEPVEFAYPQRSRIWHSKTLWGTLSLLAATVLFGQVAWLKFDEFSVIDPYRSYYAKACEYLECRLPERNDRDKIRAANLVVRSHPIVPNALVVDAVLQNMASFPQEFPHLDLVFVDTRDTIVAARRIEPENYLGGELAGTKQMPVRKPVHIAVEILDPGERAVGYKIGIAR